MSYYPPPPPPPYEPTIPPAPFPRSPRRSIWQWYRTRHPMMQLTCGCLTIIGLLVTGLLCTLGTPSFVQGWQHGEATSTALARGVTTTPTQATQNAHLGSTLDTFVAQYGPPVQTAPNYEVFSISSIKITAYINTATLPSAQTVNRVAVTGPSTWRPVDAAANCAVFLPDDAVRYTGNVDAGYIDYHSSLGDIVLQIQAQNCLLFIAPSS